MPISINGTQFVPGPMTIGAAPLTLPNGTAALPGIIFAGAGSDTAGWYRSAVNQWMFAVGAVNVFGLINSADIRIKSSTTLGFSSGDPSAAAADVFLTRRSAAYLRHGDADAASPVAQTIGVQGSRAGTDTNVGGAAFTINPSIGTGTGTPANLVINGIVGATTGTGAQTVAAVLTSAGVVNGQLPSAVVGSAALATTATDGFLYIPTCAGPPTGVPTTFAGRIPFVYDSTNDQLYFYRSGWKQPKTPAGAATVTWQ